MRVHSPGRRSCREQAGQQGPQQCRRQAVWFRPIVNRFQSATDAPDPRASARGSIGGGRVDGRGERTGFRQLCTRG